MRLTSNEPTYTAGWGHLRDMGNNATTEGLWTVLDNPQRRNHSDLHLHRRRSVPPFIGPPTDTGHTPAGNAAGVASSPLRQQVRLEPPDVVRFSRLVAVVRDRSFGPPKAAMEMRKGVLRRTRRRRRRFAANCSRTTVQDGDNSVARRDRGADVEVKSMLSARHPPVSHHHRHVAQPVTGQQDRLLIRSAERVQGSVLQEVSSM